MSRRQYSIGRAVRPSAEPNGESGSSYSDDGQGRRGPRELALPASLRALAAEAQEQHDQGLGDTETVPQEATAADTPPRDSSTAVKGSLRLRSSALDQESPRCAGRTLATSRLSRTSACASASPRGPVSSRRSTSSAIGAARSAAGRGLPPAAGNSAPCPEAAVVSATGPVQRPQRRDGLVRAHGQLPGHHPHHHHNIGIVDPRSPAPSAPVCPVQSRKSGSCLWEFSGIFWDFRPHQPARA